MVLVQAPCTVQHGLSMHTQ